MKKKSKRPSTNPPSNRLRLLRVHYRVVEQVLDLLADLEKMGLVKIENLPRDLQVVGVRNPVDTFEDFLIKFSSETFGEVPQTGRIPFMIEPMITRLPKYQQLLNRDV